MGHGRTWLSLRFDGTCHVRNVWGTPAARSGANGAQGAQLRLLASPTEAKSLVLWPDQRLTSQVTTYHLSLQKSPEETSWK